MLKTTFILICTIATTVLLSSCNEELIIAKQNPKIDTLYFAYRGDYEIIDKMLYADSSGKNLPFSFLDVKKTWKNIEESRYTSYVSLTKDSIYFTIDTPPTINYFNKYQYKMKKDSIYIEGQNASDSTKLFSKFIGTINSMKSIDFYTGCYYYLKQYEDQVNASFGRTSLYINYDHVFGKDGFIYSPSMLNTGDTLAWCNVKYRYPILDIKSLN